MGAPRSTIYAREAAAVRDNLGVVIAFPKRGPKTELSDDELTELIRRVINDGPFAGEGHRKVTARLRREHRVSVDRKRVLRLMRRAGLLAPQRAKRRRKARPHDGTIIPEAPDLVELSEAIPGGCPQGGSLLRAGHREWLRRHSPYGHGYQVLAHNMDLVAIAEGVETEDQLDRLKALGCDLVQGYYPGRPQSPEDLERFLST